MTHPPEDLERLLARARVDHDPSAEDKERVLTALRSAWANEDVPGADSASDAGARHSPAAGRITRWTASAAAKGVLSVLVLSAVGLAVWPSTSPPLREQAPPPAVLADDRRLLESAPEKQPADSASDGGLPSAADVGSAPATPGLSVRSAPADKASVDQLTPQRVSPRFQARAKPDRAAPSARVQADLTSVSPVAESEFNTTDARTAGGTEAARTPSASDELLLLRRAQFALRDGAPRQALHWLGQHTARFPAGILREERAALTVLALCAAGETDAGIRQKRAFLRDAPRSPIVERVRSACTSDEQTR